MFVGNDENDGNSSVTRPMTSPGGAGSILHTAALNARRAVNYGPVDENQQNARIQQAVNRYNGNLPPYCRSSAAYKCSMLKLKSLKPSSPSLNDSGESHRHDAETRYPGAGPGHLPVVILKKPSAPVEKQSLLSKLRTGAAGLPHSRYLDDTAEKYSDYKSTRSVLEVLHDLSRKRIHGKDDVEEASKRRCKGLGGDVPADGEIPYRPLFVPKPRSSHAKRDQTTQTFSNVSVDASTPATPADKKSEIRRRLAKKNNDILASLSSSISRVIFTKRKRDSDPSKTINREEGDIAPKKQKTSKEVVSDNIIETPLASKEHKEDIPAVPKTTARSPPTKDKLMRMFWGMSDPTEMKRNVLKALKDNPGECQFKSSSPPASISTQKSCLTIPAAVSTPPILPVSSITTASTAFVMPTLSTAVAPSLPSTGLQLNTSPGFNISSTSNVPTATTTPSSIKPSAPAINFSIGGGQTEAVPKTPPKTEPWTCVYPSLSVIESLTQEKSASLPSFGVDKLNTVASTITTASPFSFGITSIAAPTVTSQPAPPAPSAGTTAPFSLTPVKTLETQPLVPKKDPVATPTITSKLDTVTAVAMASPLSSLVGKSENVSPSLLTTTPAATKSLFGMTPASKPSSVFARLGAKTEDAPTKLENQSVNVTPTTVSVKPLLAGDTSTFSFTKAVPGATAPSGVPTTQSNLSTQGTFTFGKAGPAALTSKETPVSASSGFSFGATESSFSFRKTPASSGSTFSFGNTQNTSKPETTNNTSGSDLSPVTTESEATPTLGVSQAATTLGSTNAPGFNFGAANKPTLGTGTFTFGPNTTAAVSSTTEPASLGSSSNFTFGVSSAPVPSFGTTSTTPASTTPASTFGAVATAAEPKTTLSGAPTSFGSSGLMSSGFSFGLNVTSALNQERPGSVLFCTTPKDTAVTTSSSAFGIPAQVITSLGTGIATTTTPTLVSNIPNAFGNASTFGTTSASTFADNKSNVSTTTTSPFSFGSSTSVYSFGASAANNNAGAFGTPAATSNSGAFGTQVTTNNTGAFGAQTNNPFGTPATTSSTGAFGAQTGNAFGTPATTTNSTGAFGAQNSNAFGTPATTSSTGAFGALTGNNSAGAFGTPAATNNTGAFGAQSGNNNSGAFGTPAATNTSGVFGAPVATGNTGAFGGLTGSSNSGGFGAPAATNSNAGVFCTTAALNFGAQTLSNNAFGTPSSTNSTVAFGSTATTPSTNMGVFGAPATNNNLGAFGSSSNIGGFGAVPANTNSGPFGAPSAASNTGVFGAPSATSSTSAFGAPSANNTGAFGALSPNSSTGAFGAPSSNNNTGTFGTPSSANNNTGAFGALSANSTSGVFGAPSSANNTGVFGAPSASNTTGAFGAPSASNTTGAFGAPSSASNTTGAFGAPSSASNNTGAFGGPSVNNTAGAFGTPAASNTTAPFAFGAPSSSTMFNFGANSASSTGGAFSFGSTNTANQTPTPGTSGLSSTFGAPSPFSVPGTFSIGSGSTQPRSRTAGRLRRRN